MMYWWTSVNYSSYTGRKFSFIINNHCKDLKVKVIFSPFKLSTMFSPKDLFLILLNHVLFISLHVRAVELVILVKPIGILTHVLMSSFVAGHLLYTVESRFLEPPGETQIDSRSREFQKSKMASNYV